MKRIIAVLAVLAILASGFIISPLLADEGKIHTIGEGVSAELKAKTHIEGKGVPSDTDILVEDKERQHLEGMGVPAGMKDRQHTDVDVQD